MLYLYFCSFCNRIRMLSGYRTQCPACDNRLVPVSVSYDKYVNYTLAERKELLKTCTVTYPFCNQEALGNNQ